MCHIVPWVTVTCAFCLVRMPITAAHQWQHRSVTHQQLTPPGVRASYFTVKIMTAIELTAKNKFRRRRKKPTK